MTDIETKPEDLSETTGPVSDAEEKVEETSPEKATPGNASSDDAASENSNGIENFGVTKLECDIIRQIEYYFGDSNLSRDKFLIEQISKDDGWVEFTTLLTFKRLASMTTNVDEIVNALQKSDEGLVEISEDKLKIRRHPERPLQELNEERRNETFSRTAYAKGFPLDTPLNDIIEFTHQFGKIQNVLYRKYLDKPTKLYKFKGSVFITFEKKEEFETFIAKEKVEFNGKDLLIKSHKQYYADKKTERSFKKPNKQNNNKEPTFVLPKGTVIHFEGASNTTTREQIKEAIEKLEGEVAYIEFNKGEQEGHIRMQNENAAKPLVEKVENQKLEINGVPVALRLLTEEEEITFLGKAIEHMKSRRVQSKHRNGAGQRKRRGGDRNFKGKQARNM